MKTSSILGAGSLLFGKRKYKIIFVGLQFAFLAWGLLKKKNAKKENSKKETGRIKA